MMDGRSERPAISPAIPPASETESRRGSAVIAAARRRALHAAITERGEVSVSDIAKEFGISEMTVRRDLDVLQQSGSIERSHGGAVLAKPAIAPSEPSFAARRNVRAKAKQAIARAAAELIAERDVVGLDVGSSIAYLAAEIGSRSGLSIVTNSLQAVAALTRRPVMSDVYVVGGYLRAREGSLCGAITQRQLADHWLNKAFVGVAGINPDGLFDYSVEEVQVTLGYIRRATEVIVLCDSSKFGRRSFARVCGLESISTLVTDQMPPPDIEEPLRRHGVNIVVAESERELDA
ncbi:MAG TPA: DeoR/GlpR family DNA-binding transcription regulator [Geminicoccus sp.]|jgi:DeoR family glycerol-3-phosphate regulon repressor|uniref:DeoR/GlpR family DNA-binding transcription regulator n=1 Tax=Geminicoccus sp. TaxID=2024832 RepID=UPI002E32BD29|nr:DeoR/GlpR family DNA-binding transcription regulator [Geminicoccus sp.]HEX2526743.1 DeoR/GlpR family DNA-binding transcription regulator [Geminicoccus sp.]